MQVYTALYTDTGIVLIAARRHENQFWDGANTGIVSLMKQAGQFCLPGGRQNPGETEYECAAREFLEETGVPVPLYSERWKWPAPGGGFTLVGFKVAALTALETRINTGLAAGHGNVPVNHAVRDWELSEVSVVSLSVIENFLGNRVELPRSIQARVDDELRFRRTRNNHSIDWYGQCATELKRRIQINYG